MKQTKGRTEIPTRYRQPSVGMMAHASRASKHAPNAQKKDMTMMARPRTTVGKNSAYSVQDWKQICSIFYAMIKSNLFFFFLGFIFVIQLLNVKLF